MTLLSTEEDAEVGAVDKNKAVGDGEKSDNEGADEVTEDRDEGGGGVWLDVTSVTRMINCNSVIQSGASSSHGLVLG